jgi:hypothetical protein
MPENHAQSQAAPRPLSAELEDACFYLVDYDFEGRAAVFSRARPEWFEDRLRLSAFDLPLESLTSVPISAMRAALPSAPTEPAINYLFHLPFCGSSFLTRHLEDDAVLLIRDPASLDAVFRKQPGREYPPFIQEVRDLTLACLNRRLGSRTTVVRTAGYYPDMLEPLIQSPTFRSGMLLYCSPEHYLLQVLKSAERRRHVRALMAPELSFVTQAMGQKLDTLTDVSVAALFWIRFAQTALRVGRGRLRTLDCERLFADPEGSLARVAAVFGIPELRRATQRAGAIRATHAKTGESFGIGERAATLEEARAAYRSELAAAEEILVQANAAGLMAELASMSL